MTCFCTLYAIVIAVAKDLPDTEGDLENNIETFATKYGVGTVSLGAAAALAFNYLQGFAWCLAPATRSAFRPYVLLPAHTIMLAVLLRGVLRLRDAKFTTDSLKAFYRLIWALFYSEYFLFPFI
jgi:4-hydroxybenzoate polyprenyltransferase